MNSSDPFHHFAQHYDSPLTLALSQLSINAIQPRLKPSHTTFLDFGCGTGLVGLALLNEAETLLMVDKSEKMIEQVNQKIVHSGLNNVTTYHLDIEGDNNIPQQVDTIFSTFVFHHLTDTNKVLAKLYDSLLPDGQLILIDVANASPDRLVRQLETQGFTHILLEPLDSQGILNSSKWDSLFILTAEK